MYRLFPATAILALSAILAGAPAEEGFTSLFNGQSLEGWQLHTGLPESDLGGKWTVLEGALVGEQDPPGRGGFLRTNRIFKNFILKLETKLDFPADSGVFLRVGEDGKSHQVTLDNRPEGQFGSIYLPWTQNRVFANPEGARHFRQNEWNEVTIQIEGEPARIRFWLNGQLVTDFRHTAATTQGVPAQGYVALQIHPGEVTAPHSKVYFRNIRIQELADTPPPPVRSSRTQ